MTHNCENYQPLFSAVIMVMHSNLIHLDLSHRDLQDVIQNIEFELKTVHNIL